MRPYSHEALELSLMLEAGIIDIPVVIAWADDTLLKTEEFDDDLATICLSSKVSRFEMVSRLNKLIDEPEKWGAMKRVMARMHDILLTNPERAYDFAKVLENFCIRHNYEYPKGMGFMAYSADYIDLAQEGILGTTLEEETAALIENLAQFKGSQPLQFGEFGGDEAAMSTEDDFTLAEWQPTDRDLDGQ